MQNLTFEISSKCVNMVDIYAFWEKISFFSKYVIFQSANRNNGPLSKQS